MHGRDYSNNIIHFHFVKRFQIQLNSSLNGLLILSDENYYFSFPVELEF